MLEAFRTLDSVVLKNDDYLPFARHAISSARESIRAAIFIVDPRPAQDPQFAVRDLLESLGYARWTGVNTRVLVGISNTLDIRFANRSATDFLARHGVDVREYAADGKSSLHSKYIVIDDRWIIVGSHNWTDGAFFAQDEDSIALGAPPLCMELAGEFDRLWTESEAK